MRREERILLTGVYKLFITLKFDTTREHEKKEEQFLASLCASRKLECLRVDLASPLREFSQGHNLECSLIFSIGDISYKVGVLKI